MLESTHAKSPAGGDNIPRTNPSAGLIRLAEIPTISVDTHAAGDCTLEVTVTAGDGFQIRADYSRHTGRWAFRRAVAGGNTITPKREAHFTLRQRVHFALNSE